MLSAQPETNFTALNFSLVSMNAMSGLHHSRNHMIQTGFLSSSVRQSSVINVYKIDDSDSNLPLIIYMYM